MKRNRKLKMILREKKKIKKRLCCDDFFFLSDVNDTRERRDSH
jgi:hypothetical protein